MNSTNSMNLVTRVRGWWWPLGPATVVVPAAAIGAVVVAMTWPMLGWPYPVWVATSAQFHQMFTWAGLIAGTASCWYAVRFHPRDRIWVQPQAPGLGAPTVSRHLTLLVSWFVGAYVLALAPLVVATVVAGGVGTPDPLAMLSGVMAMIAAVALGYAIGTVVPSVAMVVVTAAGFYALLVVGNAGGESYAAVAPALYLEPELGQRESLPLLAFRIAVFVIVAGMAVGLATTSSRRLATGATQPWRRLADVGMYAAAPTALVMVSLINQPVMFEVDEQPAAACTVQRDIRYCVHVENRPRLIQLVDTVDPVIARYGTAPDLVNQIWDQSLTWGPIDINVARTLQVAWLYPNGTIETDIPTVLSGLYSCSDNDNGQDDSRSQDELDKVTNAQADVQAFLASDGPPTGILAGMSVREVQHWIAQYERQLHTCTLTPADFPQP